jgi:hypothetical protein
LGYLAFAGINGKNFSSSILESKIGKSTRGSTNVGHYFVFKIDGKILGGFFEF